jgi:hypothetical protein
MSLGERITNQLFFYCACCYSEPVVAIVDSRWVSRRNKKKPNQSRVIQSGEQITCTYMPCWVQLITRWRLICCPKFSRVTHRDKKLRKVTADEAWQRNFNRFVYLSYLFIFTFVWRICPVFLSDHPVHFSLVWWFLLTIAHNLFIVRLLFLHKKTLYTTYYLQDDCAFYFAFRLSKILRSQKVFQPMQPRPTF